MSTYHLYLRHHAIVVEDRSVRTDRDWLATVVQETQNSMSTEAHETTAARETMFDTVPYYHISVAGCIFLSFFFF